MNKLLAVALTSMLLLAGCLDAEDAADQIGEVVDTIVPGCDDPSAYNYNNSSDNDLACLSQDVLTASLTSFVLFMDSGPAMGDTAGISERAIFQQMDMEEQLIDTEVAYTLMVSPNGSVISNEIDFGSMGEFEQTWWAFPGADNTTALYVDYNGEEFMMTSAMSYTETMADFIGADDMDEDTDDMDEGTNDSEDVMWYCSDCNCQDMDDADGFGEAPAGYGQCIGEDESSDDLDTPEVDLSLYDWASTNFTMDLDITNPNAMFNFGAEVTVEGYTHEIDVKVNEALSVRAITVHYPDYNETVTLTLHTEAEVTAMLAEGAMQSPVTEALPFILEGMHDMGIETMASDADGNPLFVTLHDCVFFVEEPRLTNATYEDIVNSTSINDDICGTGADAYTFAEGENLTVPFEVRLVTQGDNVAEGSAIVFHNNTSISTLWLMNEGNATTEADCNETMGSWDNSSMVCTVASWTIETYDAGAVMVDGDIAEYIYDETNGVLLFISYGDYYVCDDNETIPDSFYNDGEQDCADGSDEPNDSTDNGHTDSSHNDVEFVDAYECVPFVDATALNNGPNSSFFEVHSFQGLDYSLCGTIDDGSVYNFTQTNVTVPLNLVFFNGDGGSLVNVTHDGANLTVEWVNWTYTGNSVADCVQSGGLYDNATDACHEMYNITNADGTALELHAANDTELLLYDYNTSSMSGLFYILEEKFVCDDGQLIDDYRYNDMFADCLDGSDEPDLTSDSVDWEFIFLLVGETEEDGFELTIREGGEHIDVIEFQLSNEGDYSPIVNWTVNTSDMQLNHDTNESTLTMTKQSLVDTYSLGDGCYIIDARIEYDGGNVSEAYGTSFCVGDFDDWYESTNMWTVWGENDMFAFSGDLSDYNIVLSECETTMDDDDEPSTQCGADVVSIAITSVMMNASAAEAAMMDENTTAVFVDADGSGTLTSGDQIGVPGDGGTSSDWNTVRLHSTSADAYSDENPTLPGFTGVLATLALLGAVLVRREN